MFARVGTELISRGHSFTVLLSSADETSQHTFITRKKPGMQAITFQGTAGVGTLERASRLSRDPVQVDHKAIDRSVGQNLKVETLRA